MTIKKKCAVFLWEMKRNDDSYLLEFTGKNWVNRRKKIKFSRTDVSQKKCLVF